MNSIPPTFLDPSSKSHGVLLVEDDPALVRTVLRNLAVRGYEARAAGSVAGARRLIGEMVPGVILLDIDLPDGSGWDVLRELRGRRQAVPVIVVSASWPNARLVHELQVDAVLQKPFPMESLLRLVSAHTGISGPLPLSAEEKGSA